MRTVRNVVAAPDSFKGSLSALQVARAMADGARRALGPEATISAVPMADGGEGTLDALLDAWHGHERRHEVTDALGRPRTARYGLSADGTTAVIEAAEANGLPHVRDVALQPLRADSAGVGELARAALEAGAREILLCIGGSATTDGGTGVLRALGARLLDRDGRPTEPGGGGLAAVDRIDLDDLHPLARQARWRIAVDVDNPLVGELGAAAVFGPQKGATPSDVAVLDAGLAHLAARLADATRTDEAALLHTPGMGAAGGLPASLSAVLGAEIVPGSRLVADAVGLPALLADADVVLTGEGSFDAQSLHGKVVDGVRACAPDGAAVVVVAGRVELSATEVAAAGLAAAVSIARGPATEDALRDDATALVAEAAEAVCRLLAHSRH
ncbi:glycerate kinase [Oceanitalea stevensii]|uniref:Glycerate kinase n=1 Tax=Oceanitalea stevensii TaxID=2763072 RepID=A0ABR8Z4Y4_9MICO|nr:glycerate kinase [Oceanitalea stevensii]MBD8063382.1 glycerate kinase [Oceanitalea stevensii]